MNRYLEKAEAAFEEAKKKITKSKSLVSHFFGNKEDLMDDALNDLNTAATNYKICKYYDKYIDMLLMKADLEKKLSNNEYLYTLIEIASTYRKIHLDNKQALHYYELALAFCLEESTDKIFFVCKKIINIYENTIDDDTNDSANDTNDQTKVIEFCEEVISKYDHLINDSDVPYLYQKIAEKYFEMEIYDKAAIQFEKYINVYIEKNTDKKYLCYLLEKCIMKLILSILANDDYVGAKKKFDKYSDLVANFSISRSGKLVDEVLNTIDKMDEENFTDVVKDYDSYYKLTKSEVSVLFKIKKINFIDEKDIDLT